MENLYVDESESLVCTVTDAQYSAESDLYLQQQLRQRKQQSLVRSSSLELELDEESKNTREETNAMNGANPMGNSPGHMYQNCIPKSEYDNVRLKPISRKTKCERASATYYYHQDRSTRELETEYANAEILENTEI
jgi:hypothetical protein